MKNRMICLALTLLVLPVCSGCWLLRVLGFPVGTEVPYNPKAESGEVAVKRDVQFNDIPVPMGFQLRREKSYSFTGKTFRFGRFYYEGIWGLQKTMAFYRSNMPLSGWELVEEKDLAYDAHGYLYRKGRERCSLKVEATIEGIEVTARVFNAARVEKAPEQTGQSTAVNTAKPKLWTFSKKLN